MGRGFIFQAASNWQGAVEAFDRVFELIGDEDEESMSLKAIVGVLAGLRAREESAWCLRQLGRIEEALSGLEIVLQRLNLSSRNEEGDGARINLDHGRCLWRIGMCLLASESESK